MYTVNIVLFKEELEVKNDGEIADFEYMSPEEEAESAMAGMKAWGHECNSWCRPPFAHMSAGAAEEVEKYFTDLSGLST